MGLTQDDIRHLANLARLDLTDEELTRAEHELDAILGYVDRLSRVETTNVDAYALDAREQGWRPDVAETCDDVTREYILSNFPERAIDMLRVPAVFSRPKGTKDV